MTSELVFAPGILKVVTNEPDLRGFVFGRPPLWQGEAAAGETRFGPSFTRTRWPQSERVTEYLTVRVADVPPGSYTLRAVADLGGGQSVVTERQLERR